MTIKRSTSARGSGPTTNLSARVPNALAAAYRDASATTGRAQNRLVLEALTLYAGVLRVGWMAAPDPTLAANLMPRAAGDEPG